MKYIVKNCPTLSFSLGFYCDEYQKKCQDCTDCVMKQIVAKCKGSYKSEWAIECNNYRSGRYTMARDILNLLDIQEDNQ